MTAKNALGRHRTVQKQVARADHKHTKQEAGGATQAGAREYPSPPFPEQHPSEPGSEAQLSPPPFCDAPFYRGSGKLANKTALITGGDSGIGRAVAILFARKGADVAIACLSEHKDAGSTKESAEAEGRRYVLIAGDVSDRKFYEKAVARTVGELGGLHVLANHAAFQIHALTGSLATHLVPRGIRVNAVAPGPVWTPLNPSDEEAPDVSKFGADTPMKRPVQPEEIALAYVFLASPQCSSYINGEILPIIGGYNGA
jgi:NAD(P)-dependent dehydrogenase (short-subunit alcohol dehydrogenase family)